MISRHYPHCPLIAACTAIWRDDKILLARRRARPNANTWAMPGGVVEIGETLEQAAIREVKEETSLVLNKVVFNRFHEIIRRDDDGAVEMHYVLAMFVGHSSSGKPQAGDDAAEVQWFSLNEMETLSLTSNTREFAQESLRLLPQLT